MALWKPFRGNRADLDSVEKHDGYVYFCIDDATLFFDYADADGILQRKQINANEASSLVGYDIANVINSSDDKIPTSKAVLDAIDERIVQSDWNQTDPTKADYIKNKPIYKNINQVEISEITWDGNTDNKLCVENPVEPAIKWYKISDLILSKYNLMNATVTYNDDTSSTIYENPLTTEDGLQYYPDESTPLIIIYGMSFDLMVVLEDNVNIEGVVFPESGIYLFKCNDDIIRYITKIELATPVVSGEHIHTKDEITDFDHTHTDSEVTHGEDILSNILETYILTIDYDTLLAFDTSEIIIGAGTSTTSVLGQAILGQMVLA